MNGRASKRKGDSFERELAAFFRMNGIAEVGRAPLSGGGNVNMSGGADLIGTPGIFVEAKRTERLNVRDALRQAEANIVKSGSPESPVVITRRNREATEDALVVMRLKLFMEFYQLVLRHHGYISEPLVIDADDPVELIE